MPSCCVCSRTTSTGKTFTLTPEELAAVGPEAPSEVHYCKQCLKVMQDRDSGAQLLKGLYEMQLAASGVPNAKQLSEQFHAKLLQSTARKMH